MELNSFTYKVNVWLNNYFINHTIVSEVFLIGSVLDKKFEEINDVDIIQKLKVSNKVDLVNYSLSISQLKFDFRIEFEKSLHITTFTSNEYDAFDIFINKNNQIKVI